MIGGASAEKVDDMEACYVQAGCERSPLRVTQSPRTATTAIQAAATETSAAQTSSKPAFENNQRFYVPDDVKEQFEAAWQARHAYMETQPGFIGFNMAEVGDSYTVTSKWASIPEWEAFNLSKEARRHHLPWVCPPIQLAAKSLLTRGNATVEVSLYPIDHRVALCQAFHSTEPGFIAPPVSCPLGPALLQPNIRCVFFPLPESDAAMIGAGS